MSLFKFILQNQIKILYKKKYFSLKNEPKTLKSNKLKLNLLDNFLQTS